MDAETFGPDLPASDEDELAELPGAPPPVPEEAAGPEELPQSLEDIGGGITPQPEVPSSPPSRPMIRRGDHSAAVGEL